MNSGHLFHAYMFCVTKDSMGLTIKYGQSRDAFYFLINQIEHFFLL